MASTKVQAARAAETRPPLLLFVIASYSPFAGNPRSGHRPGIEEAGEFVGREQLFLQHQLADGASLLVGALGDGGGAVGTSSVGSISD